MGIDKERPGFWAQEMGIYIFCFVAKKMGWTIQKPANIEIETSRTFFLPNSKVQSYFPILATIFFNVV